jgi:hypothetical protein
MMMTDSIKQLERENKKLWSIIQNREGMKELVLNRVSEALKNFRWEPQQIPKKDRSKRNEEVAVVHLSDTQIGKLTKSYDSSIAAKRIKKFGETITKLVVNRRTGSKVEKCILLIGGDIVEGETIFSTQPWVVDSDLWDQAIKVGPKILADLIIQLSSEFRHIHILAVPGNHGRSSPKNIASSPRTNFDMICTQIARLMVSKVVKEDRLTWNIDHNEFYCTAPVLGHSILLIHGDQISGGGGIGGYPLTGLARKIAGWSGSIPEDWEYIFLGHFHRPMSGVIQDKMFFANGTTESDNDFALEIIGESGRPCQRIVFINKEHGLVSDSLVWLD